MTKTERTIYALVGPTRYNTLPFSLAIDLAMELLFVQNIAMDDVRVTRDIYEPIWAIGTGKTATGEQAAEVCTYIRSLIEAGEVEQYLGKPIRDLRAPNEMIFYLAFLVPFDKPFYHVVQHVPTLLF